MTARGDDAESGVPVARETLLASVGEKLASAERASALCVLSDPRGSGARVVAGRWVKIGDMYVVYPDDGFDSLVNDVQKRGAFPFKSHVSRGESECASIKVFVFLIVNAVLCGERVSQMTKTYNDVEAVTRLLDEVIFFLLASLLKAGPAPHLVSVGCRARAKSGHLTLNVSVRDNSANVQLFNCFGRA